jgi:acyl-CoA reductase-like NAD-dependent aldehyde dehydrogenase
MLGPQVSKSRLEKIERYCQIGLVEGAELLIGGHRSDLGGDLEGGYYFEPTVFKGDNKMRIFQEETFGPVLAVTTRPRLGGAGDLTSQPAGVSAPGRPVNRAARRRTWR